MKLVRYPDRQLTPVHLNGNLLASVKIRTTGPDPNKHEIIEIGILPVDSNLERRRDKSPFDILLKPNYPDRIDWDHIGLKSNKAILDKAMMEGHPQHVGLMLFESWSEGLELAYKKRIAPIGHDYNFESRFLREWRGPLFYAELFDDSNLRDVQVIARFLNDLAAVRGADYPFPKVDRTYLANLLHVYTDYGHPKSALHHAAIQADMYKELIRHIRKEVIV